MNGVGFPMHWKKAVTKRTIRFYESSAVIIHAGNNTEIWEIDSTSCLFKDGNGSKYLGDRNDFTDPYEPKTEAVRRVAFQRGINVVDIRDLRRGQAQEAMYDPASLYDNSLHEAEEQEARIAAQIVHPEDNSGSLDELFSFIDEEFVFDHKGKWVPIHEIKPAPMRQQRLFDGCDEKETEEEFLRYWTTQSAVNLNELYRA